MTANGTSVGTTTIVPERQLFIGSRLMLRILVALIISSAIVMVFFVTAVVSH